MNNNNNKDFYQVQVQGSEGQTNPLNQTFYTWFDTDSSYSSYQQQIDEIHNMYYTQAQYGSTLTRTIIDIRTNLIASQGTSIICGNKQAEQWIKKFMSYNKLDTTRLVEMVRIGEMEGKVLNLFKVKKKDNMVKVLPISHKVENYYIVSEYDEIKDAYEVKDGGRKGKSYKNFVLTRMTGKSYEYNNTPPLMASLIQNVKDIDKANQDFRDSNNLYGHPTPAIKTATSEEAENASQAMSESNWKVGNSFASSGTLYFPTVPESYNALTKEIEVNIKMVSSLTNIPPHWLGYVELMSNRATADELENLIKIGTQKDRTIWAQSVKEIIIKAMEMSIDAGLEDAILYDDFEVSIPYLSEQYTKYLSSVYLPLYQMNVITKSELRSFIPSLSVLPEPEEEVIAGQPNDIDPLDPDGSNIDE